MSTKTPTGSSSTLTMIPEWADFGKAGTDEIMAGAPTITEFVSEGLPLEGAKFIQVVYEAPMFSADRFLPEALAPVKNTFLSWRGISLPETPWGPTTLAETRLVCRAGFRPRVFLLQARTDNANALDELRSRWGFTISETDEVKLRRYHDISSLTVVDRGETILEFTAAEPITTSGSAFGMNASIHAAHTPIGPRLVQVGIDYTFKKAEICRPRLKAFKPEAWNAEGLNAAYPVSAITGQADVELREIKFASELDKPALFGTSQVNKDSKE